MTWMIMEVFGMTPRGIRRHRRSVSLKESLIHWSATPCCLEGQGDSLQDKPNIERDISDLPIVNAKCACSSSAADHPAAPK
jgi:hypothetical protein